MSRVRVREDRSWVCGDSRPSTVPRRVPHGVSVP